MTPEQALASIGSLTAGAKIIAELAGGPASNSYLIEREADRWVLRVDTHTAAKLGLDRIAETAILECVYKEWLGPRLEFADAARGIQLTRYIPGRAWTARDLADERNLTRLARLLKRLHGLPTLGKPFALREKVSRYSAGIGTPAAEVSAAKIRGLLDRVALIDAHPRLCHNDLVCTNVIDGDRLCLIDWEYAAAGDPFFDLATIVEHHGLADHLSNSLLREYLGTVTTPDRQRLDEWRQIYRCLLTLWQAFVART